MNIFEVKDKFGKKIRLTNERWKHISEEHPDVGDHSELIDTIQKPTAVRPSDRDPQKVKWFYRYIKREKLYLLVPLSIKWGRLCYYSTLH